MDNKNFINYYCEFKDKNTIPHKRKMKIIDRFCKSCSDDQLIFLISNQYMLPNLDGYNISDFVIEIAKRGNIDSIIRVSKLNNLRKSDYNVLINKVLDSKNYSTINKYLFDTNGMLPTGIYDLVAKYYIKNGNFNMLFIFIKSYYQYMSLEYFEKIINKLFDLGGIYYLSIIAKLEFINEKINSIIELFLVNKSLVPVYDLIENNKNMEYANKDMLKKLVSLVCNEEKDAYSILEFSLEIKDLLLKNEMPRLIYDLTHAIINTDNVNVIIKYASKMILDYTCFNDLTQYICSKGAKNIYQFATSVENLNQDNITILAQRILFTNDIEYIYLFLLNVDNIREDIKSMMIKKIVDSKIMKYICLLIIYIDSSLIFKLFKSVNDFYMYSLNADLRDEELLDLQYKLFNIDVNNKEQNKKYTLDLLKNK